jgi:hypothetical protein
MSQTPPPPPPPPPASPSPPPIATASASIGTARSIGLVILLSIVTLGIWTLVWSYQNGDEIKRYTGRGIGGIGYLLITLLIAPVTMFLMASEVEEMYRAEGREPRITTIWGLWFLLPLIGQIVWYVRIQRAINEYWIAHGWTGQPGL